MSSSTTANIAPECCNLGLAISSLKLNTNSALLIGRRCHITGRPTSYRWSWRLPDMIRLLSYGQPSTAPCCLMEMTTVRSTIRLKPTIGSWSNQGGRAQLSDRFPNDRLSPLNLIKFKLKQWVSLTSVKHVDSTSQRIKADTKGILTTAPCPRNSLPSARLSLYSFNKKSKNWRKNIRLNHNNIQNNLLLHKKKFLGSYYLLYKEYSNIFIRPILGNIFKR